MDPLDELSRGRAFRLGVAVMVTLGYVWIFPVLDTLLGSWPFVVTNIQWRYLTLNALAPSFMTQALALGGAAALAWVLGWRDLLRFVAYVALGVVVVALLAMGLHAMDFLQLIRAVPPDSKRRFMMGMWRWAVQLVSGAAVLAAIGYGSLRAGRSSHDLTKTKPADKVIMRNSGRISRSGRPGSSDEDRTSRSATDPATSGSHPPADPGGSSPGPTPRAGVEPRAADKQSGA